MSMVAAWSTFQAVAGSVPGAASALHATYMAGNGVRSSGATHSGGNSMGSPSSDATMPALDNCAAISSSQEESASSFSISPTSIAMPLGAATFMRI